MYEWRSWQGFRKLHYENDVTIRNNNEINIINITCHLFAYDIIAGVDRKGKGERADMTRSIISGRSLKGRSL